MNKKGQEIIIGFGILVFLVLIITPIVLSYSSAKEITITIKDKERIAEYEDGKYLIFTENEVFENTDSFLFLKFDSSDVYNKLEVGSTYKVKVNWYRIKFLSNYRNILEILEWMNLKQK